MPTWSGFFVPKLGRFSVSGVALSGNLAGPAGVGKV